MGGNESDGTKDGVLEGEGVGGLEGGNDGEFVGLDDSLTTVVFFVGEDVGESVAVFFVGENVGDSVAVFFVGEDVRVDGAVVFFVFFARG